MAVVRLDPAIRQKAIDELSLQGNITKCAKATGIDRTTVARIVFDKGTGEETKVAAITKYIKSIKKSKAA